MMLMILIRIISKERMEYRTWEIMMIKMYRRVNFMIKKILITIPITILLIKGGKVLLVMIIYITLIMDTMQLDKLEKLLL